MIKAEICINSDSIENVKNAVTAAREGGATTVELCAEMQFDGLTPPQEHILAARKAFGSERGLMVMIRPRKGDFCYSPDELEIMHQQIKLAAQAGADGVVIGVLDKSNDLATESVEELIKTSRDNNLSVTFHRAFDAISNPLESLEVLFEQGVDRILTSGVPWGESGTACDGISQLQKIIKQSRGRTEIVIGGGINPGNVRGLLKSLPLEFGKISVHAYSGVQEQGRTTARAVKRLVAAVKLIQV